MIFTLKLLILINFVKTNSPSGSPHASGGPLCGG